MMRPGCQTYCLRMQTVLKFAPSKVLAAFTLPRGFASSTREDRADSPPQTAGGRPLAEICNDLSKRVPEQLLRIKMDNGIPLKYIPWYHANRILSFYAPGWSGEIRSVTYAATDKSVTIVYRVTIRGSDGEAYRESCGTASMGDTQYGDPEQKAEGMAFRRACARFGLGLYLYHEDEKS